MSMNFFRFVNKIVCLFLKKYSTYKPYHMMFVFLFDAKNSVHWCQIESRRQSVRCSREEELICFARQRGTQQACTPLNRASYLGGFGDQFCSNGLRLLIRLGCVQILHSLKWSRSVVSDSLRPHGLLPTRLFSPWDFRGKNIGVGCHFLL